MESECELVLDGQRIRLAFLKSSSNDAFNATQLVFDKPRWTSDDQVSSCLQCNSKFSAVKRKHHCRHCGQIFCNVCCKDKILLPYLGYGVPERICEQCKPYIEVMVLSFSPDMQKKVGACQAWYELSKHTQGMKEILECGALHVLVHMSKFKDKALQSSIIQCFHALAVHSILHPHMVQVGIVKVICRYLNDARVPTEDFVPEVISLLTLFCRNPLLKVSVVGEGVLVPLLQYSTSMVDTVSLMALQCISLLCDQEKACDTIANCQDKHYLSKIFTLAKHKDEQIREVSLRILASISSGSDYHRQRILQEEVFSGGHIASVLGSRPDNVQVLVDAACLVANLAATENTQGGLRDHLEGLCSLIPQFRDNPMLMQHVARGLANFATYKLNSDLLCQHFSMIVSAFLTAGDERLRRWGFRVSLALLEHNPSHCIGVLQCEGVTAFLQCLSESKDGLQILQRRLSSEEQSVIKVIV